MKKYLKYHSIGKIHQMDRKYWFTYVKNPICLVFDECQHKFKIKARDIETCVLFKILQTTKNGEIVLWSWFWKIETVTPCQCLWKNFWILQRSFSKIKIKMLLLLQLLPCLKTNQIPVISWYFWQNVLECIPIYGNMSVASFTLNYLHLRPFWSRIVKKLNHLLKNGRHVSNNFNFILFYFSS